VFSLFACLLAHCGGDASNPPADTAPRTLCELVGNAPCDDGVMTSGTETGNPPSLQLKKLYLLASPLGVAVVGEPGAIDPPNASVRVTNLSTGASAEGTARNDGSLDLVVAGSLDDAYEITVSSERGATTVPLGANASNSAGALGSLSCQTLENTLSARIADSFSSVATACTSDFECDVVGWDVGCYFQCGQSFVTAADAAAAQTRAVQATAGLCGELAGRCVREGPADCPPPPSAPPACIGGTCTGLDIQRLSCDGVASRAGTRRNDAVARAASTECQVDTDCVALETSISCVADCGSSYPVPAGAVETLQRELTRIEQQICQNFTDRSCPGPFALPCDPSEPGASRVPICFNNRCDFATLLP